MKNEPNLIIKTSLWHRFWYGHWRELKHIRWDYSGDYYSNQCVACDTYCERIEMGYNCKGKGCGHK